MADQIAARGLSELRLNAEERESVADIAGEMIAIQVYRELQKVGDRVAAGDSGCNIIGNCSSSCKKALLGQEMTR